MTTKLNPSPPAHSDTVGADEGGWPNNVSEDEWREFRAWRGSRKGQLQLDERVEEIREKLERIATPPWHATDIEQDEFGRDYCLIVPDNESEPEGAVAEICGGQHDCAPNAEFIANSPQYVSDLLTKLYEARDKLERREQNIAEMVEAHKEYVATIESLETQLEAANQRLAIYDGGWRSFNELQAENQTLKARIKDMEDALHDYKIGRPYVPIMPTEK